MKPDYERDGVRLYLGRCEDVLPSLDASDLLLTDPPYGIGRDGGNESTGSHGGRKAYDFLGWDVAPPTAEAMSLLLSCARHHVIWGGNYMTACGLPPRMGWIVWDKGQRISGSDAELAFTSFNCALRVVTMNRVELLLDGAQHPTQKPLRLMHWCIGFAAKQDNIQSIIDPYMGSGTTGVAAVREGRRFIGIECERRYFDIAVRRIDAELRQGKLFGGGAA